MKRPLRLSLSLAGMSPLPPALDLVEVAEACGLDGIWSCEQIGFRDALVPSAVAAGRTRELEIGVVGLSSATRHPGLLAMEVASLAEFCPGRLRVAVGAGDPGLLAKLGQRVTAPLSDTRALVRTLRDAFAGRVVDGERGPFRFEEFGLNGAPLDVGIDVMAVRPRMLAMAAEEADGVHLSMGSTPGVLRESVAAVEEGLQGRGRARGDFRVVATCMLAVAPDHETARSIVRSVVSMAEPDMAEYLARDVLTPGALHGGGAASLSDEAVDELAVVRTPDDLQGAFDRYAETGIDELALFLLAPPDSQPDLVRRIAATRDPREE
ncbi:MAG: LLM class flavin-dependent oxidoreductase [Myxococcota bacterium]|nr:LLM class flavin-dependent oxidoreductase [Myxococcota bacterium]